MEQSADTLREQIIERSEELAEHIKLLRDYATTPDNVWLAQGELAQISERVGELEALLTKLKAAED